jgi:hypothetical protein
LEWAAILPQMTEVNERELEVLEYLLSLDFPGRDELQAQVQHAHVISRDPDWIEFAVDKAAPDADVRTVPAVETLVSESDPPIEILLHARAGRLKVLEVVTYGEPAPDELPPPDLLDPPVLPGA